ncbi:MAG TPA: hypothetical protein PKW24_01365 [Clostridiales bacterium]|mgnify:CR=1 FL=1|jgi:ABC-2 type transport system permease protein|nr:hypothetical protein [Clostridiales bacterium]HRT81993.1 hypothetical protein [Oscillospiraceae bacterium]
MFKLGLLLKIQFKQLAASLSPGLGSSTKSKLSKRFMIFLIFFAFVTLSFNSYMFASVTARSLSQIDALRLLPGLTLASASLVMLLTTLYRVKGTIFAFKDYDFLMSLPVSYKTIALSRLILLYFYNFTFSLLIIVPASVAYAIEAKPDFYFYLVFALTLFLIPLIPISLASVLGTLIHTVSFAFKKNNLVNIFLSLSAIMLIMGLSANSQKIIESVADISSEIMAYVNKLYPPADFYVKALCDESLLHLFMFSIISLGIFFLLILLLSKYFRPLNSMAMQSKEHKEYQKTSEGSSSPFLALYKRELKRYFSSSVYVTNTAVGFVLFIFLCLSLIFTGSQKLENMLGIQGFTNNIDRSAPAIASLFIALSSTTAASISLEGKSLWILKSLPVNPKLILNSKLALNLSLSLPTVLIGSSVFSYFFSFNTTQTLFMFLVPAAYAFFSALLGLAANLKFPNFDWTSEVTVIKQSAAVFIAVMVGLFAAALPLTISFLPLSISSSLLNLFTLLTVSATDLALYLFILTKGLKIFDRL